jgi:prolyl-tRNA synthetase family I
VKKEINPDKSSLGVTANKSNDFSGWYSQVLKKAELIEHSPVSGCMVLRPYAYSIWESIQSFIDSQIKKMGVKNAYFPMLIPESLLKKEQEHVEGFTPEVAWVTMHGNTKFDEKLAIRPTSETIMYDSYSKWVRSHKDLPLKINQWCSVVRWEFKHPTPFLRTREFLWQEGHTVFATSKEAEDEVLQILNVYSKAYEELLAVPVLKGRKTDSEKFAGAVYTLSVEAFLPNTKAVQAATSHYLGQNFSKAFNISFLDEKGARQHGFQNSWGLSTRSIGIMLGVHGDEKGIVLPPRVAPVQVVIIPIVFSSKPDTNKKVLATAKKLQANLASLRVELDDREGYSPGYKFNYWELKGVPVRIEIGPREAQEKKFVAALRDSGLKREALLKDAKKEVELMLEGMQESLYSSAKKLLADKISSVNTLDDAKTTVDKGLIALLPLCGSVNCESKTKERTGAKALIIPFEQPKTISPCLICGLKSKHKVYFAKAF